MIGSTRRRDVRLTRALCVSGIALMLLATGCASSKEEGKGDPTISAQEERNSGGALEALKVEGKRFTPNGAVLVTVLAAVSGSDGSPYVEEEIRADGSGEIRYERRPVPCPQPANYKSASWISVIARDMTSGISGSAGLDPGREPDCRGS